MVPSENESLKHLRESATKKYPPKGCPVLLVFVLLWCLRPQLRSRPWWWPVYNKIMRDRFPSLPCHDQKKKGNRLGKGGWRNRSQERTPFCCFQARSSLRSWNVHPKCHCQVLLRWCWHRCSDPKPHLARPKFEFGTKPALPSLSCSLLKK